MNKIILRDEVAALSREAASLIRISLSAKDLKAI
jgi:hypothetical protein